MHLPHDSPQIGDNGCWDHEGSECKVQDGYDHESLTHEDPGYHHKNLMYDNDYEGVEHDGYGSRGSCYEE